MSFADNKRNSAANDMRPVIGTEEHLPWRGISKINAPPPAHSRPWWWYWLTKEVAEADLKDWGGMRWDGDTSAWTSERFEKGQQQYDRLTMSGVVPCYWRDGSSWGEQLSETEANKHVWWEWMTGITLGLMALVMDASYFLTVYRLVKKRHNFRSWQQKRVGLTDERTKD